MAFTQKVKISDGNAHEITGTIFFQGCNEQTCISPQKVPFEVTIGTGTVVAAEEPKVEETPATANNRPAAVATSSDNGWWAPVDIETSDLPALRQKTVPFGSYSFGDLVADLSHC